MNDQDDFPPNDDNKGSIEKPNEPENTLATDDIYEEKAMLIVERLLDRGLVHMDESTPVLVHEPSGRIFESSENLAHFHKGWEAARKKFSTDV